MGRVDRRIPIAAAMLLHGLRNGRVPTWTHGSLPQKFLLNAREQLARRWNVPRAALILVENQSTGFAKK
jgi:hypothetical protein